MSRKKIAALLCLLVIALVPLVQFREKDIPVEKEEEIVVSNQTPVATAEFSFENGVPMLHIAGVGKVEHPGFIAMYALSYMGKERFYDFGVAPSEKYAANCVQWLKEHAEDTGTRMKGWSYSFDNTYNDVTIQAPWYSAFGQACGIEALVCWYEKTGDEDALNLAREAAEMFFVPIEKGGQLFVSGDDIWFEEIPSKEGEPSHILNGHMRALLALRRLYDASGDEEVFDWYRRGAASLVHWMPLYDAGYWIRYDLNPKKLGLVFRFNNPYAEKLSELAIDEIRLEDPVSGQSAVIDVGGQDDMEESKGNYLAGIGWQAESIVDGHTVRRFVAVAPEPDVNAANTKPNCYFYINLPSTWESNFRRDWLKLTIRYKDETHEDVVVEQRSIAPDEEFVTMRDGVLLLTGSGEWREWSVPVRPQDLGWPVGMLYGEKHKQYLEELAADISELAGWAEKARGYWNTARLKMDTEAVLGSANVGNAKKAAEMPKQNVIFPCLSTDENGVVMQHDFVHDGNSKDLAAGDGYYSPYLIAAQAMGMSTALFVNPDIISKIIPESMLPAVAHEFSEKRYSWLRNIDELSRQAPAEAAYRWLRENAISVNDGIIWRMDKKNTYNDLIQEEGWQSAFWQRYVIDAYIAVDDVDKVLRAALAYGISTEQGGLCSSWGGQQGIWFEEVPNNSHILNAHLASLVALHRVNTLYSNESIKELERRGLQDLRENLYLYDTGYWTKYDMNPQKNILFAFVWEGTTDSPLIDDLYLYNPVENNAVRLDIGTEGEFEGASYIAGNFWQQRQITDGRTVRAMTAYQQTGIWENAAFMHIALPYSAMRDDFLLPDYYYVVHYKDTSTGTMRLFRQSIAEGTKLVMLPLPEATITCVGDNEWKTAVLRLPSQQMGWYMGSDYQAYHNEQLGLVAEQTGDWYLKEIHAKWVHYLQLYQATQEG